VAGAPPPLSPPPPPPRCPRPRGSPGGGGAGGRPPRGAAALGSACARNPLPVVIPCHRVVRGDGAIGQYVGGVVAKQALLSLEAAA
uniref:methylated-DNA--[protein]-cysteine S-methyltransferase n=1 Tax=Nocardia asiatica TaxID=209252 RepID=UPI002458B29A